MKRRVETYAALDELLTRIGALIRRARNIPILFVQHDGPVGHRLERGSPGWQIRPEITPVHGAPVIHKSACDSFFETTLTTELTSGSWCADRGGVA
jgi:nicotinamidase-related amidase